jgi:hypothetical protein
VHEVPETVTGGKGSTRIIVAFYLSEEAALMVATRLRTTRAVAVTREIVSTFVALRRGEISTPAAPTIPSVEPGDHVGQLLEIARGYPAGPTRDAVLLGAVAMISPASRPVPALPPHVEPGAVDPLAAARAEELALPVADPAPGPTEWLSPTRLAVRLTVACQRQITAQGIGLALSALGYRDRPELYRLDRTERAHGAEGPEVNVYRWSPATWAPLLAYFRAMATPAPRKARARKDTAATAPAAA